MPFITKRYDLAICGFEDARKKIDHLPIDTFEFS